jgi:hypothetical protein
MIAKEMLLKFKNNLGAVKGMNRQYSDEFAKKGAKIGSVINVRKPVQFTVTDGAAMNLQDVTDQTVALTLDKRKHVAFQFSSQEMTLSIDEFSKRYIDQAALALANQVDIDGLKMAQSTYNAVGTPGATPSTLATYLSAGQKISEFAGPRDNKRSLMVTPAAESSIVDALKGLFQSSDKIADQYEDGMMGRAAGFNWRMAQNIYTHTVGALGGTPLVNGASQTGASLVTAGWTAAAATRLKKGDIFTIANVYAVNPITKQSTGSLQQFVVTSDSASDGSGNMTIPISPSITLTGPYQTVNALAADNAALTVLGAANTVTPCNLAFHKDAYLFGTADLDMPKGVDFAAMATDEESGISLRIVRDYDINNDTFPCRVDILYGFYAAHPEWACRIQG